MGGDLAKCTEAFIMADKLEILRSKAEANTLKYYGEKLLRESYRSKKNFLVGLGYKWSWIKTKECEGVVESTVYGKLYPKKK